MNYKSRNELIKVAINYMLIFKREYCNLNWNEIIAFACKCYIEIVFSKLNTISTNLYIYKYVFFKKNKKKGFEQELSCLYKIQ